MGLIGRDVRDSLREDWKIDFRRSVARALVGVGDLEVKVPMITPSGQEVWCRHDLEPILNEGLIAGFNATIEPRRAATSAEGPKWWWQRPSLTPHRVWDAELELLARAS